MLSNAATAHCLHGGASANASTINQRTQSRSLASSLFFLSVYSYVKPTTSVYSAPVLEHERRTGHRNGGRQLAPFQRRICCNQQGWFEFSTASGGRKVDGVSVGDFTILSHLQTLGCGDLKRKPREVHFSGCINESYAFRCTGGDYFVKINRQFDAASMFAGEAEALNAMLETESIRVPKPLGVGNLPDGGGSYIILEYLNFQPFGMMQPSSQEQLGRALALMHSAEPEFRGFGLAQITRLGVLPLSNEPSDSWSKFFLENRLRDRLERAIAKLGSDGQELATCREELLSRATKMLDAADVRPSVLHGDLWVGNSGLVRGGGVAVFDPAGYVGHSEFDLAFRGWEPVNDFPGFSDAFYDAYHAVLPQAPGFEERHRLYQLFHLLNHLLIYGVEYYPHVMAQVRKLA
ncbi:Putative ribulosamine/erythrulosamine 3-kinase [Klebsormidium nitens]|uniref:protein-ribulosamine 3-kinase n=1 Tax=Klebsormidium nitens TaxID=105231 RepID=A0A1Y1HKB8_KLENI|nr:Putative ribulosamine/erythrulosamine 3-kinase [Klebsormidium nitens]|eukprot:GAQ79020.1 Putative ribulosamine/erythrulosamine 3-kinase [Klebsormidium nitens]